MCQPQPIKRIKATEIYNILKPHLKSIMELTPFTLILNNNIFDNQKVNGITNENGITNGIINGNCI